MSDEAGGRGVYARVLYSFATDAPSVLQIRAGDIVEVLTQLQSGWWDGVVRGKRGWFPANYCVFVSNSEAIQLDEGLHGSEEKRSSHSLQIPAKSLSETSAIPDRAAESSTDVEFLDKDGHLSWKGFFEVKKYLNQTIGELFDFDVVDEIISDLCYRSNLVEISHWCETPFQIWLMLGSRLLGRPSRSGRETDVDRTSTRLSLASISSQPSQRSIETQSEVELSLKSFLGTLSSCKEQVSLRNTWGQRKFSKPERKTLLSVLSAAEASLAKFVVPVSAMFNPDLGFKINSIQARAKREIYIPLLRANKGDSEILDQVIDAIQSMEQSLVEKLTAARELHALFLRKARMQLDDYNAMMAEVDPLSCFEPLLEVSDAAGSHHE